MSALHSPEKSHLDICMEKGGCLGGRFEAAERIAHSIWTITEPPLIPGILQTAEYTETVLDAFDVNDEIQRNIVLARRERRIERVKKGIEVVSVVDEAVLYHGFDRSPKSRAIHAAQLAHMAALSNAYPNIVTLVRLFNDDLPPQNSSTSLALPFARYHKPSTLLRESLNGLPVELDQNPAAVGRFVTIFERYRTACLDPEQSLAVLGLAARAQQAHVEGERSMPLQRSEITALL